MKHNDSKVPKNGKVIFNAELLKKNCTIFSIKKTGWLIVREFLQKKDENESDGINEESPVIVHDDDIKCIKHY